MTRAGKVALVGLGVAGGAAIAAGAKMISMASDAAEVDSKMDVVFGKALPKLTKNLDEFAEATGASRYALREQAADMGALLEPLTANKKGAADMSAQFVKLATDLGSFNNVPVGDALIAIRAGLVGEAEPLRRFGVLLNAAAVESEGLRLGLVKQGQAMTEQQKVQARASLIMQQTTLAQGDATRTADSMANQMKRLRNNISDAATSLGTLLIPFALRAVRAFNENWPAIERIVKTVMTAIASGVTSAIATIERNWELIKSTAVRAFDAARSAGQTFVSFLRTSFGQQMVAGALATAGLYIALVKIRAGVAIASSALATLNRHPFFLALIPLGLAIGTMTQKFIEGKIRAAQFEAELRKAAGGADALKASLDRLNQSETAIESSKLALISANQRLEQAEAKWQKVLDAGTQKTAAGKAAYLERRQALNDVAAAEDGLTAAQRENAAAQEDRNTKLGKGTKFLLDQQQQSAGLARELDKLFSGTKANTVASENFATTSGKLEAGLRKTAFQLRETDPAASKAAAKSALLAQEAENLALKLGRVPKKSEIVAQAKAVDFPKFYASLLELGKKIDGAKGEAQRGGWALGTTFGNAVEGSIMSYAQKVASAAAAVIRQAINFARMNAGSTVEQAAHNKLGKPLGDNILLGFLDGSAQLPAKMSEKLRAAIDTAAAAVQAQQAKLSSAFQRLSADALRAFDAATDAGLARIQAKLDARLAAIASQLSAALAKIEGQRAQLTPSEQALADAEAGLAAEARAKALADAQAALAKAQAEGDAAAIAAAQEQLLAANREIALAALRAQAAAERAEADKKAADLAARAEKEAERQRKRAEQSAADRAKEYQAERELRRRHLEDYLAMVEEQLAKEPKKWAKRHDEIMRKFKAEFGPDFETAGENLGKSFAKGLEESMDAMGSAAEKLARLIAKYLKTASPTELGPFSDLDKWGKRFTDTYLGSFDWAAANRAIASGLAPPQFTTPRLSHQAAGGGSFATGGGIVTAPIEVSLVMDSMVVGRVLTQRQIRLRDAGYPMP